MPTYNLASLLEDTAADFPDRTAVVLDERRLTYAQLDDAANQVANLLLARGVRQGDKVALMCPNVPAFPVIYYGVLKAGATVVPLNILFKGREVAYHLADSEAKVLFAFEGDPALPVAREAFDGFTRTETCADFFVITADPVAPGPIEEAETLGHAVAAQPVSFGSVPTDEDDTAVILYTSGTTGQPKGAELRHRNMRDNALACSELFRVDIARPDTFLCALPLFHSFGQTIIQNAAFAFGGTVVMLPRFDAHRALDLMTREEVTFFAGVPTMYWSLLGAVDAPGDNANAATIAKNLRVALSGGAALPVEIHHQVEHRFGVVIAEGYGLSETSPSASFKPYGMPARAGSIGMPIPGVEMRLIGPQSWAEIPWSPDAVGEIAIRGHNVMKGYYRRPEATAAVINDEGWLRTGDLARRDQDGWYYIVDRSKDLIIRGGFNVYPREIEEVLLTHPAVSLAAVVGVSHESHGEEVKAVVVLERGAVVTPEELIAWSKEKMAAYKYPRIVEISSALPMTATGKILKRELA